MNELKTFPIIAHCSKCKCPLTKRDVRVELKGRVYCRKCREHDIEAPSGGLGDICNSNNSSLARKGRKVGSNGTNY